MAEDMHQEFEGITEHYNLYRPDYPEAILDRLKFAILPTSPRNNVANQLCVVDVGAGTGISTRLLRHSLGPDVCLLGVEPGNAMRQQAIDATPQSMNIRYINAQAENLPFQNASISAIVVAQAIQWFDRPSFYKEADRVLSPHGLLAAMQNNRDWKQSPFLDAYETFLESNSEGYSRFYRSFDIYAELKTQEFFQVSTPYRSTWERSMAVDDFIGMSLSSTKMQAVVRRIGEATAVQELRNLIQCYEGNVAQFVIPYVSELFLAHHIR